MWNILENQTAWENQALDMIQASHVVLIFSQGNRIGATQFESARRMITTTFQRFPDVYFIFVTNDRKSFQELTQSVSAPSHWAGNVERFNELIYPEHFTIIESSATDPQEITETLTKVFRRIPKRITPCCSRNRIGSTGVLEIEDYVSPNQEVLHRISPFYFRYSPEIQISFNGVGYGDLTICQSRNLNQGPDSCQSLKGMDAVTFNTSRPCADPMACPSIYYSVSMDVSRMRCVESDCRFPDQVRYIIRQSGLSGDQNSGHAKYVHKFALISCFAVLLLGAWMHL